MVTSDEGEITKPSELVRGGATSALSHPYPLHTNSWSDCVVPDHTTESSLDSGRSLPFLDVLVTSLQDGLFKTTFSTSPHILTNIWVLAQTWCSENPDPQSRNGWSNEEDRAQEKLNIVSALEINGYPGWFLEDINTVTAHSTNRENVSTTQESFTIRGIPHDHLWARCTFLVILPYIKGVLE